ncbi:MAG TPA: endolytic transglycosylase MltG [Candidatus Polarisedimenticolia bacterium]|nr:endolytic transglycosylase MltG [Candidatus Polarisedimenticolia bacterium]
MKLAPALYVAGAAICCAGALGSLAWRARLPYKGHEASSVTIVIVPGRPARAAAARLHEEGIIRSPLVFRLLMRLRGAEESIHAGEYEFTGALTPDQVLDKLTRGDVVRHRLTIPEGLRLDEIADAIQAAGFGGRQAFIEAAHRVALIADLDPEAEDLEGYLFPDTYLFARGTSEARIVEEMVERFRLELLPERMAKMKTLGLTLRQTVTLASLIEEEAQVEEERARIAGVFHNRLRLGMPLQCDPTVVYALTRDGRYRGEIYRSDLTYHSPYNTYVTRGLPPGPICGPGARSLEAALNPAATTDLYFVVSGPGHHQFSSTRADHEKAVRRYRQERENPGRRR